MLPAERARPLAGDAGAPWPRQRPAGILLRPAPRGVTPPLPVLPRIPRFWIPAAYTALALAWSALWLAASGTPWTAASVANVVMPEVLFWNGFAAVTPAVWGLARRISRPERPLAMQAGLHGLAAPVAIAAAFAVGLALHAAFYAAASGLGAPLAGTLGEQLADRVARVLLPIGIPLGVLVYALVVAVSLAVASVRRLAAEQARAAALEADLAQAEVRALKMQIRPHFLFNALNTISSTLQEDPAAADRMLTRLGDFFRLTLAHDHRAVVPLREEVAFNRAYLQIEQDRLEERLRVRVDVAPEAAGAAVPYLVLQPLVENALRHGIGQRVEGGSVEIRAAREGGALVLEVCNTGPGLRPIGGDGAPAVGGSGGIGLANTRDRLRHAYGARASLELSETADGVCACIRLPFEAAPDPLAPEAAAPEAARLPVHA